MKSSIIIPTYKRTTYLLEALRSVKEQDFPLNDFEIIIVDNAPDPTPDLAALHHPLGEPSVHYVHEPKNGLHQARHAGAKAAQGEILVYIDDDVLCPPGWLEAMLKPYRVPNIAMVAGKVNLAYESEPPSWLHQFNGMLSAFDRGESSHPMPLHSGIVGCNMSVRKSVLFAVGGFNPDGFDPRFLPLRGDGENGLARKVQQAGWLIWYEPRAWLWHRVSADRLTSDYIQRRSAMTGVELAYIDLRYRTASQLQLLFRSFVCLSRGLYHQLAASGHQPEKHMYHMALASQNFHQAIQHWRQAKSISLRNHTKRAIYL